MRFSLRSGRPSIVALAVAISLALNSCADTPTSPSTVSFTRPPTRLLWIGNSNTEMNDLPGLVAGIASAAGLAPHERVTNLSAGASLEDHIAGGVERVIAHTRANVVIMQQGASATPEGSAHLKEFAGRLAPTIRAAGGTPAVFGVWTSVNRKFDLDAARLSHQAVARSVNGLYFPISEAWRAAWRRDPQLQLYIDAIHANETGALLAAYVIVAQLYGVRAVGLPHRFSVPESDLWFGGFSSDPTIARLLQESADEAIARYGYPDR